ncbi:MAG: hypothetical protein GY729_07635 [Desulfobacteraceae bacterium]|nr:hypothetical protein [Desulfobacteraceae bacterium]
MLGKIKIGLPAKGFGEKVYFDTPNVFLKIASCFLNESEKKKLKDVATSCSPWITTESETE